MLRRSSAVVTLGTLFLGGTFAFAATDPADKCTDSKTKATGKVASDLLKAIGKNLAKNPDAKFDANVSKARSKFTKGFTKAEAKGGCPAAGASSVIEAQAGDSGSVELLVNEFVSSTAAGVTDASVCCELLAGGIPDTCTSAASISECEAQLASPGTIWQAGSSGDYCGYQLSNPTPGKPSCLSAPDPFPAGCCQLENPIRCLMADNYHGVDESNCELDNGVWTDFGVCNSDGTCQALPWCETGGISSISNAPACWNYTTNPECTACCDAAGDCGGLCLYARNFAVECSEYYRNADCAWAVNLGGCADVCCPVP